MTSIHPPSRSILLSTVASKVIIVIIIGTEPHAIMIGKGFVAWIISKMKAIKGIPGFTTNKVGVSQPILVFFTSHFEYSIVSSAVNKGEW